MPSGRLSGGPPLPQASHLLPDELPDAVGRFPDRVRGGVGLDNILASPVGLDGFCRKPPPCHMVREVILDEPDDLPWNDGYQASQLRNDARAAGSLTVARAPGRQMRRAHVRIPMRTAVLDRILDDVRNNALALLRGPFVTAGEVQERTRQMTGPGVYAVKRRGSIIYVGESSSLRGRLYDSHVRGERNGRGNSQFRNLLRSRTRWKVGMGLETRMWIERHCTFAFREMPSHDMAKIVEAVLIQALRPTGYLLNSDRNPA